MSQQELEFAWLASIYSRPEFCRKNMLYGVDQSMFQNQKFFELGLKMLRADDYSENQNVPLPPPDWLLSELLDLQIVARLEIAFDEMQFMPAFYKFYCAEIERRAEEDIKPEWIG